MNIFGIIILFTLLFEFVLDLVANILNIKTLKSKLPVEFEDVYDPEVYGKSQLYTKTRTVFGMIVSTFNLVVLVIFWFAGGFNSIDIFVRGFGLKTIVTGLCYVAILMLLRTLLSLPFSIYSTFVIEGKFGFNKTTPKIFIMDLLKGLVLSIIIGGPVLAGILAFFEFAGGYAWLYCWVAAALFTLFIQFIAPTWIMPIFNKFTPLADGDLKKAILSYAESVKFSVRDVFVMDGSKRSTKANAFFTGFGKNKRIALFDTLVEKHTVPELVAVLAHEIGHYKKKHIIQGMVISIVQMGVMFFLLSLFINNHDLFNAFFMKSTSVYASLLFFGMLFTPIDFVISMAMHVFSRKNEYEADRFAAETTEHHESMVNALKKLSRDNLSHLTPHPLYVWLNYSHPPVLQRIRAIRNAVLSQ